MTPDALILTSEILLSSASSTPLAEAEPVIFAPPVIASFSLRRLIVSSPESEVTVNAVPTDAVVAEVILPFESIVITGTSV